MSTKISPRVSTGGQKSQRRGASSNGSETIRSATRSQCVACDCWFNPYPGQTERLLCSDCAGAPVRQLQLPFSDV